MVELFEKKLCECVRDLCHLAGMENSRTTLGMKRMGIDHESKGSEGETEHCPSVDALLNSVANISDLGEYNLLLNIGVERLSHSSPWSFVFVCAFNDFTEK